MIHTLDDRLAQLEKLIAATSLLSLLLLSLLQILARNFFDTGFPQLELLNRHLLIIAGLMGACVAVRDGRHIRIDALTTIMSDRLKQLLRIPLLLFAATVAAALCYYAVIFCLDEWEYAPANERWALPLTLVYPVSFAAMTLHFLFTCLRKAETG